MRCVLAVTPPSGGCRTIRVASRSGALTSGVEVRRRATDSRLLHGGGAVDDVGPSATTLLLPLRDHLLPLLHWFDEKLLLLHPDHAGLDEGETRGLVEN